MTDDYGLTEDGERVYRDENAGDAMPPSELHKSPPASIDVVICCVCGESSVRTLGHTCPVCKARLTGYCD